MNLFGWILVISRANLPFLLLSASFLLQPECYTMEIVLIQARMEMSVDSGELMAVTTISNQTTSQSNNTHPLFYCFFSVYAS